MQRLQLYLIFDSILPHTTEALTTFRSAFPTQPDVAPLLCQNVPLKEKEGSANDNLLCDNGALNSGAVFSMGDVGSRPGRNL